ncbi:MAG: aspartate/glutamate racemase family protein [Ruminococcaceae bacterium]|nr:aspartate/glutamate racemase family protein [Oscillospiraceae bacterium]
MQSIEKKQKLLGILGGLGPMASIYFCEMLTSHTKAERDSEHINFLLSSRADTPDRSSFILGTSKDDPTDAMIEEALRLERAGADIIAIPCNTAHYFYDGIQNAVNTPILNIITETARFCSSVGVTRIGVLATEGTAASGAYEKFLSQYSISTVPLTKDEQDTVSKIIFERIKCGLEPDVTEFLAVVEALRARGSELIVLGCTELSLIKKKYPLPEYVIDSLELLALCAIAACGKTPTQFDPPLMKFYGSAGKDVNYICSYPN